MRNCRRRKGRGKGARKSVLEMVEELGSIIVRKNRKLRRENQGITVDHFSWKEVGDVMRRGTVEKEEPRQMGYPIRRGTTGMECAFEAMMEAFHHDCG